MNFLETPEFSNEFFLTPEFVGDFFLFLEKWEFLGKFFQNN